jgi:hypothetical protein
MPDIRREYLHLDYLRPNRMTIKLKNQSVEAIGQELGKGFFTALQNSKQQVSPPVWDATVFTKNRNRLLEGNVAREFLGEVLNQAREQNLTSDEHLMVDGTLLEACQSEESFSPRIRSRSCPTTRATTAWTSMEKSAAMPPTSPRPTRM